MHAVVVIRKYHEWITWFQNETYETDFMATAPLLEP